jgi:tRNA A-37 threonylcarbamoyl transferase component Bud32
MQLEVREDLRPAGAKDRHQEFKHWMHLRGKVYRDMPGRRTQRFLCQGKSFFIKQHFGLGFREGFKELLSLRLPVWGASAEKKAMALLTHHQINTLTLAGYGKVGRNPFSAHSFLITEDFQESSDLEQYCRNAILRPDWAAKKSSLILRLAVITQRMHAAGMNHRDYYLCHFLLRGDDFDSLALIDCHRAQCRKAVPMRWQVKDLASLYFSAMEFSLSVRDCLSFIRAYSGQSYKANKSFWDKVSKRAKKLKRRSAPTTARMLRKQGHGLQLPLSFELPGGNALRLEKIFRHLPGKRLTCRGRWQGEEVAAKLFFSKRHAEKHARREENNSRKLRRQKIATPRCLGRYALSGGVFLVMFEYLSEACPLKKVTDELIAFVAAMHARKIIQPDIHLANFMSEGQEVTLLDVGSVKKPFYLSKKTALNNLALLLAQMPGLTESQAKHFYQHYCKARGWDVKKFLTFSRRVYRCQQDRLSRYLKKLQRKSTAHVVMKGRGFFSMCNRKEAGVWHDFLKTPESFLKNAEILKAGRSATVFKLKHGGEWVVVKRYNLKNVWHRLRRCCRGSRAMHSWRFSHVLQLLGVPTPRAIAVRENRFLGLRGRSYFVMEYAQGSPLTETLSKYKESRIAELDMFFLQMKFAGISHGDLKASNLLVSHSGVSLIDLDGMKCHARTRSCEAEWNKNYKRFLKNWEIA